MEILHDLLESKLKSWDGSSYEIVGPSSLDDPALVTVFLWNKNGLCKPITLKIVGGDNDSD